MSLEFDELSNRIIRAAIEVHKKLGPGFLESIYQKAVPFQLRKDKMIVETQREVKISYDGEEIGMHRLDLVVEKKIVVELKTVTELNDNHLAQLLSYLKATGIKIGLLLNFTKATLEIKRVVS